MTDFNRTFKDASARLTLSEALTLWIDITGVDPGQARYRMGDWDVMDMHRDLKEALELDDTEITGKLIFEYLVSRYLRERAFSVETLIASPDAVAQYLAKSRQLLDFLRDERMNTIRADFQAKMRQACAQYGATGDALEALLDNPHQLAILRRDALRTMDSLRVDQFLDGEPEPEGHLPAYGKFLYRWNNINSMLRHMTRMPSGVTLNMICHPVDTYRTYFAFAIRNGGRIFVFTDKEKSPHPMAEDLERRPDKVLANRAARHWFPYSLMGLSFDEDGQAFIAPSESESLVSYQADVQAIEALSNLDAPNFLWIAMMLDLIVAKFWKAGYRTPALSYTGEMIRVQSALIESAVRANLPVKAYSGLSLPTLSCEAVREVKDEKSIGRRGDGAHAWMIERYGHRIDAQSLNLLSPSDRPLALSLKSGAGEQIVPYKAPCFGKENQQLLLSALDPCDYGTQEEIEANRLFVARSNYACQINQFAQEEFDLRHQEVIAWVRARIENNFGALSVMMKSSEHFVPALPLANFDDSACTLRQKTERGVERLFMKKELLTPRLEYLYEIYGTGNLIFLGSKGWTKKVPPCYHTNAPAAWLVTFIPETAEDLAFLCGCSVSELPDVLQYWTLYRKYVGNPILQRIDPMEWQCRDPWADLPFRLSFLFSLRAMKAIERS